MRLGKKCIIFSFKKKKNLTSSFVESSSIPKLWKEGLKFGKGVAFGLLALPVEESYKAIDKIVSFFMLKRFVDFTAKILNNSINITLAPMILF